jgi:hypothetical protein
LHPFRSTSRTRAGCVQGGEAVAASALVVQAFGSKSGIWSTVVVVEPVFVLSAVDVVADRPRVAVSILRSLPIFSVRSWSDPAVVRR